MPLFVTRTNMSLFSSKAHLIKQSAEKRSSFCHGIQKSGFPMRLGLPDRSDFVCRLCSKIGPFSVTGPKYITI